MSRRMTLGTRRTVAAMTATVIVVAVVLAQPGGSAKARADSSGPTAPTVPGCCPHTDARAQAIVKPNGTVLRQKGVVAVARVATGTYCIQLNTTIPVMSTAPVVSQDLSLNGSPATVSVSVAILSSAPDCTQFPNSVEVMTFADQGTPRVAADEGFSVVVA